MRTLDTPDTPASALGATLREDIGAFQRRSGTPAHLIVIGDAPAIEGARTDVLLRAVREGLRNVERHAQATEVVVTLCTDGDGAEVSVQDDGAGPREGSPSTGIGLRGLREEVGRLGGGLRLTRSDDVGTTLRVWLPVC
jgi:LuxR family transcriptional regulator, regulator of acetate metabolism